MGILDGVLGGVVGAELTNVVSGVIERHGGVAGLVSQFEQQGLGGIAQSWVSNGPNQAITSDQLHQVLGSSTVTALAAKFGINPQDMLAKLTQVLPQAVDKLTPAGVAPKA
jgi:uncharacterized protein YidB (DUF937 family)